MKELSGNRPSARKPGAGVVDDGLARHLAAVVRGQESDDSGHVLRLQRGPEGGGAYQPYENSKSRLAVLSPPEEEQGKTPKRGGRRIVDADRQNWNGLCITNKRNDNARKNVRNLFPDRAPRFAALLSPSNH